MVANKWLNETTEVGGDINIITSHLLTSLSLEVDFSFTLFQHLLQNL